MPARLTRLARLQLSLEAQHKWIEDHGGDLPGYIAQYGSVGEPDHYGDGAEAIYAADVAELKKIEARVNHEFNTKRTLVSLARIW